MFYIKHIIVLFLLLRLIPVWSADDPEQNITNNPEQAIKKSLKQVVPSMRISKIEKSVLPGLYQVIAGTEVLWVSDDGKYIFNGNVYDVGARENITETIKSGIRHDLLSRLTEEDYIEFAPENPQYTLYVFTDISCGYCRKLHSQMENINALGIAVRYLAYPRSGPGSPAADSLAAVWCAKDRKAAMDEAKAGKSPTYELCASPVSKHYQLGGQLGIRGTPASFLDNGQALPGYLPPKQLLRKIQELG